MKITSSYAMRLTGDLKSLENSIRIYRDALQFVIPIVNTYFILGRMRPGRIDMWCVSLVGDSNAASMNCRPSERLSTVKSNL